MRFAPSPSSWKGRISSRISTETRLPPAPSVRVDEFSDCPTVILDRQAPDRLAAVPLPLRTVGGRPGLVAQGAGGQEIGPDARVHVSDLQRLLPGRLPDFLLGVVAKAHRVLVPE